MLTPDQARHQSRLHKPFNKSTGEPLSDSVDFVSDTCLGRRKRTWFHGLFGPHHGSSNREVFHRTIYGGAHGYPQTGPPASLEFLFGNETTTIWTQARFTNDPRSLQHYQRGQRGGSSTKTLVCWSSLRLFMKPRLNRIPLASRVGQGSFQECRLSLGGVKDIFFVWVAGVLRRRAADMVIPSSKGHG